MRAPSVEKFDEWMRGDFKRHNTTLEDLYFAEENPALVEGLGGDTKQLLLDEGQAHIAAILADQLQLDAEAEIYDLLGNVGLYFAALRRHELTNPDKEPRSPFEGASALAQDLATRLGVAPRFATAHVNLSNRAQLGRHKSFTNLPDELLFIKYNCLSILAYIRAADILRRIVPLGVTHPVADTLLGDARTALGDVFRSNATLDEQLDVRRFFFSVRPYFKTYRVGRVAHRGANAGDFAAINEVDLMLGLCRVSDPSYAALINEKMPFVTPEDQRLLQSCARRPSLMDEFLGLVSSDGEVPVSAVAPLRMFIATCEEHGRTAAQHHDRFVRRFIQEPADRMEEAHLRQITASGPPLAVVVHALDALKDKRGAADRSDIQTRFADMQRLRAAVAMAG